MMVAHCFFEQSGTFRDEFRKLGVESYDYDIANDYGKTDFQIDLFAEIEKAYKGGEVTVFDKITKDDVIFAFFPCTMFQENNFLFFAGLLTQQRKHSEERKLLDCIDRHETLHEFYTILCKMFTVCLRNGLKLIVENPATQPHYLTLFFPVKPKLIDKDRRMNGDDKKKPTQYWFVNCDPKQNLVFEPITYKPTQVIGYMTGSDRTRRRSEITSEYANRFIRQFILEEEAVTKAHFPERSEDGQPKNDL